MSDFGAAFGQSQLGQFSDFIWNMLGKSVGGIIDNFWFGDYNRQRQIEAAKSLIDYQNKYNSPTEQMQRLSAAGLNPNIVYGSAAPGGTSGNATAPAMSSPSAYGTADTSLAMLQARQMQQLDAEKEVLSSQAEKNRAEARFTNQQADRYNELIDVQINEANKRIEEAGSRIGLNASTEQLQAAQKSLAVAEEAYRRGEIGLQAFRKAEIVAQTNLYRSEEALNRTRDYYTDIEGQISVLELEYKKLFYHGDRMKDLSSAEYAATMKQFELEVQRIAANLGIEGNKAAQWSKWIIDRIGSLMGGAAAGSVSTGMRMAGNSHVPIKALGI